MLGQQPALGITAAIFVIGVCVFLVILLPARLLTGWVGLFLTACVPALIAEVAFPLDMPGEKGAAPPQPVRGLLRVGRVLAFGIATSVTAVIVYVGAPDPAPFALLPLVCAVPITMCLVLLFQGWPIVGRLSKRLVGPGVIVASHVIVLVIDRSLLNYQFLSRAPNYEPLLHLSGIVDARDAAALLVTLAGAILALSALGLISPEPGPTRIISSTQPLKGVVNLSLASVIVAAVWYACVVLIGMNVALFQARVSVSFVFGMFVMTVLMDGKAFAKMAQPLRGILVISCAGVIAGLAYPIYYWAWTVGTIGADGDPENWISAAMLALTFPVMVAFAELFAFWPLHRNATSSPYGQ